MMQTWTFEPYDEDEIPEMGKTSVVALSKQHRERWLLRTSKGFIVFRRMPLRIQRILDLARVKLYPKLESIKQELACLQGIVEGSEGYEEAQERIQSLAVALACTDPAPLGVIVEPRLSSMDDYEELYESLEESERAALLTAVIEMTRIIDADEVDSVPEIIAERSGLKLVTPDMIENLTVSQASYWMSRIRAENAAIERMRR